MRPLLTVLLLLALPCFAQEQTDAGDDATVPGWRYEFQREYEQFRDYGEDWRLGTSFALNSEDGLILAGGPILYHFGFRTFPYVYRMELLGGFSIPTGRVKVVYSAFWPVLSDRLSLDLRTHFSQLELRNFYGFGNDAARDAELEDAGFYRISSNELFLEPTLQYRIDRGVSAGLGVAVRTVNVRDDDGDVLEPSEFMSFGDNRTVGSTGLSFHVDTRDHPMAPHSGVVLDLQAWTYLEVFGNDSPFQKYRGEVRFYVGGTIGTDVMLALRVQGVALSGSFPFYEAAFLGGPGSLRGFPSQRFAGDASLLGSAELRFSIGRWKLIIPTEIGLFLLGDAGRVFVDGQSPGSLHTDAGAGLWAAPLNRDTILSFLVASSVEGAFIAGGIGFGF